MKRARFGRQAAADVEEIASFIARDDVDAALRFLTRIDHLRERLVRYSHIGRERAELGPGLRSYPVGRYVVFYLPSPEGVLVARILSASRDIGPDWFLATE